MKLTVSPQAFALIALLLGGLAVALLNSCATNSGDPAKDRRARVTNAVLAESFNAVVKVGLSAGANALSGRNGQDAAAGIFDNVTAIDGDAALDHILRAYAGPEIAPVATIAVQQLARVDGADPAARLAMLNTIGAAVQSAANQLAQ